MDAIHYKEITKETETTIVYFQKRANEHQLRKITSEHYKDWAIGAYLLWYRLTLTYRLTKEKETVKDNTYLDELTHAFDQLNQKEQPC